MARLIQDENGPVRTAKPEKILTIPFDDWSRIDAIDVKLHPSDLGPVGASKDDVGGFGTDSVISRGRGGQAGRELERWTPDPAEENNPSFIHLEDSVSASRGWDQFALNEARFGVKTDYKEELYTTALDPSKSKISMEEAARIAAEIERGSKSLGTSNIHLLEERGIEIDDGDMDEEDRYGAVMRDGTGTATKKSVAPPPPPAYKQGSSKVVPPPRPPAWGKGPPAGVMSSSSSPPPPPPPLSSSSSSAPINIDPRRETNKVRAQMTGSTASTKAASPYGTPKLSSPLVGDAQKLAALNLDPGVPRVDEETRREFQEFKAQQQTTKGGPNAPSLSDLKQFSEAVGSKLQKAGSNASSSAALAGPGGEKESTTPPPPPQSSSTSSAGDVAKSSLNPNAKSFSFNINAREFTPSFGGSASATASGNSPGGAKLSTSPGVATSQGKPQGYHHNLDTLEGSSTAYGHGGMSQYNSSNSNGRPYHHHREDSVRQYDKRPSGSGRHYGGGPPPPPPGSHGGRGASGMSPPVHQMTNMTPVMMPQTYMMVAPTGNGQQFAYMMPPPRPGVAPVFIPPGAASPGGSPAYMGGPGQPMIGGPIMMGPPPGGNVAMGPPPVMGGYAGAGGLPYGNGGNGGPPGGGGGGNGN